MLVARLAGDIPEHLEADFSFAQFGDDDGGPLTLLAVTEAIRKAATDDDIEALVLECSDFGAGWAKAQEIRWAVESFKESDKPVWAYLTVAGGLGYYVASAADRIVIQPESMLDVKGLRAEVSFYKETLDKIGVTAEMENVGKYKSAVEPTREPRCLMRSARRSTRCSTSFTAVAARVRRRPRARCGALARRRR